MNPIAPLLSGVDLADGQVVQLRLDIAPGWPATPLNTDTQHLFQNASHAIEFLSLLEETDRSRVDASLTSIAGAAETTPRLISDFRVKTGEHLLPTPASLQVVTSERDGQKILHAYLLTQSETSHSSAEQRALELVDGATGDGIWDWNLATGKVYYAPRWFQMLHLPIGSETRPFLKIPGLFDQDDHARLAHLLSAYLSSGSGMFETTQQISRTTGERIWIRIRAVAVRSMSGKPLRLVGSFADITEDKEIRERLGSLNGLMRAQLDASPDGILILDLSGYSLLFNDVYKEIWDLEESQVKNNIAGGLFQVSPVKLEDPDQFAIEVMRSLGKGQGHSWREIELMDGRVIEEQTRPLQDQLGNHTGRIWFFRDVTARKIAERQLVFAANLFNRSPEAMALLTPDLHITQINKALLSRLGYSDVELVGQDLLFLDSGHQSEEFYDEISTSLAETGEWEGEVWNRAKDGGLIAHKVSLAPAHEEDGPAWEYIAVFSDISETKQQLSDLKHQAHHDPLTGLPNRALLSEIIPTQMAFADRQKYWLALVMIDLDGFKPINDTHGHRIGDEVLCQVAQNLRTGMRESDCIFRLGGDEFVVSAVCRPEENSLKPLCQRIQRSIKQTIHLEGLVLTVGASLGVALYPEHGTTTADLMDVADGAMYTAKESGKGCYCLAPLAHS